MKALVKIGSAVAVGAALLAGSVSPTLAFPADVRIGAAPAGIGATNIGWRGGRFGGWRGGYGRRGGYGWGGYGYGAAGFLAGAAIGSAIARPAYAPVVVPVRGYGAIAFCEAHYRSYSPETGTYVGYDGLVRACP